MKLETKKLIFDFLKNHKIAKNDTLFIHGNAMSIAQIDGKNNNDKTLFFWECIKEYIGEKGTIIVPTFTYSATKNEIFDPLKTPSKVGQFSEDFRNLPYTKRTFHTIFSVSFHGYYEKKIFNSSLQTCFGKESIFDLLTKLNAKLICLGCSLNELTYTHHIEEDFGVNYRYNKVFLGKYIENGKIKKINTNYFVRKLDFTQSTNLNLEKLINILKYQNLLIDAPFERMPVYSCSAKNFYNYCMNNLKKNENYLIT